MSETVNANGLQALVGKPSPNSRGTDTDNISGTYQVLHQLGFDHDEISITEEWSPSQSFFLTVRDDAWEPASTGLNSSGQYAMFKSSDGKRVAYASLCRLFQPSIRCIVIVICEQTPGRSDHESRPGEQPPTGVWIGMSTGGACPPVDC